MKTYEEFRRTVYDALENSNIRPEQVIEQATAITVSIPNEEETPDYLKNLSNILKAKKLRFNSSVSVPSPIQRINISIFNQ
jgi:hypothetical protein